MGLCVIVMRGVTVGTMDGFRVLKDGVVIGGKYVAGSAVGVGFGQRGSEYPGPHCNGTTTYFEAQAGSSEPDAQENNNKRNQMIMKTKMKTKNILFCLNN